MPYSITDDNVYFHGDNITQLVGSILTTSTERIDSETVADVTYQFNLELGQYVEQSRVERTDVLVVPPTIEQQLSDLQDVVNAILMGGL